MSAPVIITVHSSDPQEPDLVYRTDDMSLRGRPATIGGRAGVLYDLTWFMPDADTLDDLLNLIGPG